MTEAKRSGGAVDLRTDLPHSARIYDYLLGGKDNFSADRAAAEQIVKHMPTLPASMRANRDFMARMVRYLAAEQGIRQFLDIGSGLPTTPNLHESVQAVAPDARVVYVDSDPIVLSHARALLTSSPEGRTAYLHADLREGADLYRARTVADTLDLDRPVAVTLVAILQFFTGDDATEALPLVRALLEPLAPGSVLALTAVPAPESYADDAESIRDGVAAYRSQGVPIRSRTAAEIAAFFDGLDLLPPGIVPVDAWHPQAPPDPAHPHMHAGVAVKP